MDETALSQLYLKDTAFKNLMQRRIFNVLLISSRMMRLCLKMMGVWKNNCSLNTWH